MTLTSRRGLLFAALLALAASESVRGAPPEPAPPAVKPPAAEKVADGTKLWLTSLSDGSTQARRRRQPVLVRVGAESCPWCRKLEAELRDPALGKELDRWTLVALDVSGADRDARALAVGPIPALRILTPDGRVVASHDGFIRAAELTEWLKKHHDAAAVVPAEELTAPGAPDAAALARLVKELNQRDPALREAAVRRILPHPQLAAKPVSEAFAKGSLQTRLAALELLREWQAPVGELDPWKPETVTAARLEALTRWALAPPAANPASARALTPAEMKSAQQELIRFLAGSDAEALAIRERLARHGPGLRDLVTAALKDATTDAARERLTALRYRLAAGDALVLEWPGGIDRLASGRAAVRHEAVQELARRATPAEEPLLLELFGNPDPFVRELSLRTLFAVAGRTATGALAGLLRDPDSNVRAAVLKQLAETPSQSVVPKIAEYLTTETDLDLVVHAVRVLRSAGGDAAAAQLKPLLKHASWRVRAEAVEALGECAGNRDVKLSDAVKTEARAAIREALADADGFVIGRAIGTLKKTAMESDVEPLVKAAAAHPELAGEVVAALHYGSEFRAKALIHLRAFCKHADPNVRARAIAAVASDAPEAVADELRAGLADRVGIVREAAAASVFNLLDRKRSNAVDNTVRSNRQNNTTANADAVDALIAAVRAGKDRPKGIGELVPLLETMLKAEPPTERLEAALALTALDRAKDAVPVLVAAVRAKPSLVGRAAEALPWIAWTERLDLFNRLVADGEKGEETESLVQNFVRVPDPRAIDPLWALAAHDGIGPSAAGWIAGALLELSGFDRWNFPRTATPALGKLAESAKTKAAAGPEMQRVAALVVLASADASAAAEVATKIYDDAATALSLRRDAFRVVLVTRPKADATPLAVKALSQEDAEIRRTAVQFLSVGTGPLRQLRDKRIYINTPTSGFTRSDSNLSEYVPYVPPGLPRELLRELLRDPDPMTAAGAGYLLALLGDDTGLPVLLRYWREAAREDSEWIWLVVMAIASLEADGMIPVVEEIYRTHAVKKSDFDRSRIVRDIYWIIRPMGGPNALRLRKTIRAGVGLAALGLSDGGP